MLWDYIRSRRKSIFFLLIVCLTFLLIFSVYGLPAGAVLYGGAISGFFGLIILSADLISYRRKRLLLKKLADVIVYSISELPEGEGIEKDYIELIMLLYAENKRIQNEAAEKAADMADYYALWAHQAKTPIAAVKLMLSDGNTDVRMLKEQLQRIEHYTDMVMCYVRLNSESTDYVIKEYDLDDIVRQAVRKFSSQFIGKKLKLIYEPLNKKVLTDEKWLSFVIEQVLSNGIKYTSSGYIEIYAEDPLTLCIKDTGVGILPEDLPRIFEKGYTGCCGRLDKKASGIGLYLCRRICERLGHKISAVTPADGGTIIKIELFCEELETE